MVHNFTPRVSVSDLTRFRQCTNYWIQAQQIKQADLDKVKEAIISAAASEILEKGKNNGTK